MSSARARRRPGGRTRAHGDRPRTPRPQHPRRSQAGRACARASARGRAPPRFVEQAVEIGSEHVSAGRAFWFAANRARRSAGDGRFAVVNLVPARHHAVPHRERALGARDAQCRLGEALFLLENRTCRDEPEPARGASAFPAVRVGKLVSQKLVASAYAEHRRARARKRAYTGSDAASRKPTRVVERSLRAGKHHQVGSAQIGRRGNVAHAHAGHARKRVEVGEVRQMRKTHDGDVDDAARLAGR